MFKAIRNYFLQRRLIRKILKTWVEDGVIEDDWAIRWDRNAKTFEISYRVKKQN
jgi:hypothetical protein